MSSFKPYDMPIEIDGMGIVFYSPGAVADIPEGSDFLTISYTRPEQVAQHIRKGDVVGFCTGSGGSFILKFREGYPPEEMCTDTAIRLAIDVQGGELCVVDLFWLSEWSQECPEEQKLRLPSGCWHITLCTSLPKSGVIGDRQEIFVYLSPLEQMPALSWTGVPQLIPPR